MNLSTDKKSILIIGALFLSMEAVLGLKSPIYFWVILALDTLILMGGIFWIFQLDFGNRKSLPLLILPLLLTAESFFVVFSLPSRVLQHFFLAGVAVILYLIIFCLDTIKKQILAYSVIVHNILTITYLITGFLGYVLIYNLYIAFGLPAWEIMILVLGHTMVLFFFKVWQNDLSSENLKLYIIILLLMMTEIAWAISFWPVVALAGGMALFVFYYAYSNLFYHWLTDTLSRRVLIEYILIAGAVFVSIALSTIWLPIK